MDPPSDSNSSRHSATLRITRGRRDAFDKCPLGIVEIDLSRGVQYANPAALELLGITDYQDLAIDQAFPDPTAQVILESQLEQRQSGLIGNYRITATRLSDQRKVLLEITGIPLSNSQGAIVGSLGIFRTLERQKLIGKLHSLDRESENDTKLLQSVAEVLKTVLPFDVMSVSRYSSDLQHASSVFTYPDSRIQGNLKRWFPLTKEQQAWLTNPDTLLITDLDAFLSEGPWKSSRDEPTVRRLLDAGIKSAIRRGILRSNKLVGSVAFMGKMKPGFTPAHQGLLDELPIEGTVLRALEYAERRQAESRVGLLTALAHCTTVKEACQTLAVHLVSMFSWSHVSVFRVDYDDKLVRLVAQHRVGSDAVQLEDGYCQAIDAGILGRVVRTGLLQNVGNVESDPDFIASLGFNTKSELCCPIRSDADDRVRWIINAEDAYENAFATDESHALEELSVELKGLLSRISQVYFLTQCFENTSDPIVVTDSSLQITHANPAAARLLGFNEARQVEGNLAGMFDDESLFRSRFGRRDSSIGDLLIKRAGLPPGQPGEAVPKVPVFVSWQAFPEGLDGYVFVARDTRDMRRTVELELLARAAYEVAVETSAPLTLALAEIERMAQEGDGQTQASLENVMRQLRRVSHGYTRLAMFDPRAQAVEAEHSAVNLRAELECVIDALPNTLRSMVRLSATEDDTTIKGDHFQLTMIFETLLAAFLRAAPEEEPVTVDLRSAGASTTVEFRGHLRTRGPDVRIERRRSEMRAGVRVAWPLIEKFAKAHGASVAERADEGGAQRIALSFPAIKGP